MEEMYGQHKEEMIKENREKRKGYKMIRTYVLHVEYIIIRVWERKKFDSSNPIFIHPKSDWIFLASLE